MRLTFVYLPAEKPHKYHREDALSVGVIIEDDSSGRKHQQQHHHHQHPSDLGKSPGGGTSGGYEKILTSEMLASSAAAAAAAAAAVGGVGIGLKRSQDASPSMAQSIEFLSDMNNNISQNQSFPTTSYETGPGAGGGGGYSTGGPGEPGPETAVLNPHIACSSNYSAFLQNTDQFAGKNNADVFYGKLTVASVLFTLNNGVMLFEQFWTVECSHSSRF